MSTDDVSMASAPPLAPTPAVVGTGAPKRQLGEGGTMVERGDLEDLHKKHADQQQTLLAELIEKSNKSNLSFVSELTARSDERARKQEERIDTIDGQIGDIESKQAAVEADVEKLKEGQVRLQEQLRVANQSAISRADIDLERFDRPANLEIIIVKSSKFVTKIEVENAITPWIHETGITRELWTLSGNTTGKRFQIKFLQNPLTASDMVQTCLKALKDENGDWRAIKAKLPNANMEKLLICGDESPKAGLQRRMATCLRKAVQELYPHIEEVHYRFRKAAVYAGKVGIASLQPECPLPERKHFLWNLPGLRELEIDKERVLTRTLALLEDEQIQWSL